MASPLEALQSLGRALMLPIAVLPAAGLLLRLGQPDLLDVPFMAAAGEAIFANLGLLFAAGVAVGLARDNNGAAGLAGVVCFLIATRSAEVLLHVPAEALKGMSGDAVALATAAFKQKAIAKVSVPIGILSGLIGGQFYNRFSNVKLPEYLAFFGGRRFVPIVAGLAGLGLGAAVGFTYEGLNAGMDAASRGIVGSGEAGLFIYGVLNRALIVTGLHHILNNIAWFIVGDFRGATGDLNRFFAGDPSAGAFMAGFFPVMMFGLPAACLAMYHAAPAHRRKAVGGMLASMALTTFLTGVTEPIEFSFMFLAPVLYAIHALLTGLSFIVMSLLDVKLGFGFSAGFFDYALNFGKATNPLYLLPIGAAYFALYYGVFRWAIGRFDLKTPGRDAEPTAAEAKPLSGKRGEDFVAALGGAGNLIGVDACTTRLRLVVADQGAVDEAALKALGSRGMVRPSDKALQVVLGPIADQVAGEIRAAIAGGALMTQTVAAPTAAFDVGPWLAGLGGAGNVVEAGLKAGRVCVRLIDPAALDEAALTARGARGVALLADGSVQILLRPA
ncbi:N-acetylglucosamine-specific PTS transporter subunit IIBC [Phenylobacterium sp. NIBR 498073]|uniref:N-acetylglucosamine-specific PTS transporter subunit IIBC n=1 Tax=Phenylobacterium sp. NIBR 498073 TaxID=3015177 RepID=UPI0022B2BC36|nr:N-acetylglucosamine-specific PTS transporter subunit IIBC [Phenylobacterium sp. NIBR 498073]WGU39044.1 N-acetylglucosamine-specific PTS transporter subunit IIBC [Phenylobacterium sp. NIBR 498073]